MSINKHQMTIRDSRPADKLKRSLAVREEDKDSVISFNDQDIGSRPAVRYVWDDKGNKDNVLRMLDDYRDAKKREGELERKNKQLAAQLARTEEAAKKALCITDATAKGGAAQKLLDAERAITKLRDENTELNSKLAREKKRANDFKMAADETKKRLEQALKDQRLMARKVGELERKLQLANHRPEDAYWGEEAGRRFVVQQEELVALREENAQLQMALQQGGFVNTGMQTGTNQPAAVASEQVNSLQSQVKELQAMVKFYERKLAGDMPVSQAETDKPEPGDWVLEELQHQGQVYLLDRATSKLFSMAATNSWPRPVGIRQGNGVKLGSSSPMERFINTLDNYLQAEQAKLQQVFSEFDVDGSGQLDRRELGRLVKRLMPDFEASHVEELAVMLDNDGDGRVTFTELLNTIKETYTARMAAKLGRSPDINAQLDRVRDVLRDQRKQMHEAFMAADSDHDGCLHHLQVIQMMRTFLKNMSQREVRYLLARLQEWDVTGEGKTSWNEVLQALELAKIYRITPGMGNKPQPLQPGRPASPSKPSAAQMAAKSAQHATATQGLKEGFLKERVAQLEAELHGAQLRAGAQDVDAGKADVLRRDLAQARARIEDLEKDYAKLDVVMRMEAASLSGDAQLHAAWEAASQFKKRYMEHKSELDTIRLTAARMQAQLDETHKLLHEEHKKRFRLEDDNTRMTMEMQRVKDLETRLNAERADKLKLEKEYLVLQSKALSAPGAALGEVRQLREELFLLRRDKAMAEQQEAEVRRELSHVREQLDGMSVDQYRVWQKEYHELKKRVSSLQLELQAAHDKLEVYRRTDVPSAAGIVFGDKEVPAFLDRRPDADKGEAELRRELGQLREVWHADQLELKKLHQVLEVEGAQTLEAKAALEESHREMDRLRRDLQEQLKGLQRELDRREERVRKLELQLRGAYSGINRALRTSKLRDSRATDAPDDMSELGDDQNLLELHISEATLSEEVLGKDPSTFFTFDFFMHDSQATPVIASNTPTFDTVVQYVVDADVFLMQYLDSHVLELELNRARGWDYDAVGVARVPLRQILEDVEIGAAVGANRAYHYADVHGADGKRIGRVRYGFSFRRPLDTLIKQHRAAARAKRPSQPDARDPAVTAVSLAQSSPASATHVKVVVARCEGLVAPNSAGSACKPYVWFQFPGHRQPHSTRVQHGLQPVYNDESTWLLARTPELEHNLKSREMEFVVFDDAGGEDLLRGIIGVAFVPLAGLAQGVPVEGAFKLINPVTKQPAGKVVLGLGWHNPLSLVKPSSGTSGAKTSATAMASQPAVSPALQYSAELPSSSVLTRPDQASVHTTAGSHSRPTANLPMFPARQAQQPVMPPATQQLQHNLQQQQQQQFVQPQLSMQQQQHHMNPSQSYASSGLGPEVSLVAGMRGSHHSASDGHSGMANIPAAVAGSFIPPRVPADRFGMGPMANNQQVMTPQHVQFQNQPQQLMQPGLQPNLAHVPSPVVTSSPVLPNSKQSQSNAGFGLDAEAVPLVQAQNPRNDYGRGAEFGLLSEQQHPPASNSPRVPGSMLLNAAGQSGMLQGQHAGARSRYGLDVEQSVSPPPVQRSHVQQSQQQSPAFTRLTSADPTQWPASDTHVIVHLDSMQLEGGVQQQVDGSFSHVFVMHALLEEVVLRLEDTCTQCVPLQPGRVVPLGYTAAYRIAGPATDTAAAQAGNDMQARLADPRGAFLDLRVFASRTSNLDLSALSTGGVRSVAVAEIPLNGLVSGNQRDFVRAQVVLTQEDTGQQLGVINVTLLAANALQATLARPGTGAMMKAATADSMMLQGSQQGYMIPAQHPSPMQQNLLAPQLQNHLVVSPPIGTQYAKQPGVVQQESPVQHSYLQGARYGL